MTRRWPFAAGTPCAWPAGGWRRKRRKSALAERRSAGQGESLASLDGLNLFGKQCESGFQITPFRSIRFLDLSSCDAAVLVFDHRAGNGLGHRWLSGRRTCAQGTATWARFRACRNRPNRRNRRAIKRATKDLSRIDFAQPLKSALAGRRMSFPPRSAYNPRIPVAFRTF